MSWMIWTILGHETASLFSSRKYCHWLGTSEIWLSMVATCLRCSSTQNDRNLILKGICNSVILCKKHRSCWCICCSLSGSVLSSARNPLVVKINYVVLLSRLGGEWLLTRIGLFRVVYRDIGAPRAIGDSFVVVENTAEGWELEFSWAWIRKIYLIPNFILQVADLGAILTWI